MKYLIYITLPFLLCLFGYLYFQKRSINELKIATINNISNTITELDYQNVNKFYLIKSQVKTNYGEDSLKLVLIENLRLQLYNLYEKIENHIQPLCKNGIYAKEVENLKPIYLDSILQQTLFTINKLSTQKNIQNYQFISLNNNKIIVNHPKRDISTTEYYLVYQCILFELKQLENSVLGNYLQKITIPEIYKLKRVPTLELDKPYYFEGDTIKGKFDIHNEFPFFNVPLKLNHKIKYDTTGKFNLKIDNNLINNPIIKYEFKGLLKKESNIKIKLKEKGL